MAYIVYSLDAGSSNNAYSVTSYTKKSMVFKEIGQFVSPVKNLTDNIIYPKLTKAEKAKFAKQGKKRIPKEERRSIAPFYESFPTYITSIRGIFDEYKVRDVVTERFQTRGIGGPLIEQVSVMNGALMTIAHSLDLQYRLVTAAQWKNRIEKTISLDVFYLCGKEYGFTPHEVDSSLIGLYQAAYREVINFEYGLSIWKKAIQTYSKK